MIDNVLLGITGVGTFFSGCYLFGRWSVNRKIIDLVELKTALIESQNHHDDLINEIDIKIQEIKDYNKLSCFDRKS
jgi:hypothetical protein